MTLLATVAGGGRGVADDVEVQDVGDPRAQHAEGSEGEKRRARDVLVDVAGDGGDGQELDGAAEHLARGERDGRVGEPGEVAAGVGEGDVVAGDSTQAGADPEQLSAAEPVPHADHDEHTGKADSEPGDDSWVGSLLAKDGECGEQRGERGEGVDDPGEHCGDVGLPVGEQGERGAVEEHGEHEQMSPRARPARQPGASGGRDDKEGDGARGQAGEGHIER